MTTEASENNRYTTKGAVRALFCTLIEPQKIGKRGKSDPQYSVTVGLEDGNPDLDGLKAVAIRVAKAAFPGRTIQNPNVPIDSRNIQLPFKAAKDRADQAVKDGKDGSIYNDYLYTMDARSGAEYPPRLVVVGADGKMRELDGTQVKLEGKSKFYHGCYVGIAVSFKHYLSQAEGGIGAYSGVKAFISSVAWLKDGPRIGGSALETFRHYAGAVTAENPLDDEVPF